MAQPSAQDPAFAAAFRRPFREQVAFFRGKLGNLIPSETWRDVQKAEHDKGFMVAGASKANLLADLAAAVEKAHSEGETLQQFRKRFKEIVARNGWTGWTGEGTKGGEAWRTRVIYQTNLSTSYAAGRLAQLKAGGYELWLYKHSDSVTHPRPYHVALDGIVRPADDPFWRSYYAPNGWGCKCRVLGVRGPATARLLGGDPSKPLPNFTGETNPKTGEKMGIDEGWGYMPGGTVADTVRAAARQTVQWDYRLAKAYMDEVPASARDGLATAMRTQPETGEVVRRYAERALGVRQGAPIPGPVIVQPYQTLGLLTSAESAKIAELSGVEAVGQELYDWALDAATVKKVEKDHGTEATEARRGQIPVTATDYALLPRIIAEADGMEYAGKSDVGRPVIRVKKIVDGATYVAAFEVRTKRRMLALQSWWKVAASPRLRP